MKTRPSRRSHAAGYRCRWQTWLPASVGPLRDWLQEPGSLSRRLAGAAPGFHVRVLTEGVARPLPGEARVLGLAQRLWLRERDVLLCSQNDELVYAHTVSRRAACDAAWPVLRRLGERPLGHLLFEAPNVRRSALVYRRLHAGEALHRRIEAALARPLPVLWARRSLFVLRGRHLLISEVFLPAMAAIAGKR